MCATMCTVEYTRRTDKTKTTTTPQTWREERHNAKKKRKEADQKDNKLKDRRDNIGVKPKRKTGKKRDGRMPTVPRTTKVRTKVSGTSTVAQRTA